MDLNNLLRTLNSNEKFETKNEILEILDLLKDSLNKSLDSCSKDAAAAGANFDFEKLKKIQEIKINIDNIVAEIDELEVYKDNKKPETISITTKPSTSINKEYIELPLTSSLSYTNPKQYIINGEVFNNDNGNWSTLLCSFANYFANKETNKFKTYMDYVNEKAIEGYKYGNSDASDKNSVLIKAVNKYLFYHGSASDLGKHISEMLKYFGYESKCKIYGTRRTTPMDEKQENTLSEEYHVNDYINHTKYGIGRIKNIDTKEQKVTINFSGEDGTKVFPFNQMTTDHFTPMTSKHFGN